MPTMGKPVGEEEADALTLTFGNRLAATKKKTRNQAVKALRRWLSRNAERLDDVSTLRIWKALFFCMWMSDKPLVQEETAHTLAALVRLVPASQRPGWCQAFFETMVREWMTIDRHRLDKFCFLIGTSRRRFQTPLFFFFFALFFFFCLFVCYCLFLFWVCRDGCIVVGAMPGWTWRLGMVRAPIACTERHLCFAVRVAATGLVSGAVGDGSWGKLVALFLNPCLDRLAPHSVFFFLNIPISIYSPAYSRASPSHRRDA